MRRSARVNLLVRERPVGIAPGVEHPLDSAVVDGDGSFVISGSGMTISALGDIEEFLRIEYLPGQETEEITLENVTWVFSFVPQNVGPFTFQWAPPERVLAEVDGKWLDSVRDLADNLANLLMDAQPKPYSARNSKIVLLWEPTENNSFTRAQNFFRDLRESEGHEDFPDLVYEKLEKIPQLRTKMKKISDAILNYLFKISMLQQHQFERGMLLDTVIRALAAALKRTVDFPVVDPMPDAAAVCALLYTAGRMAKDQGKMTAANFGQRSVSWAPLSGIKTVEISVGR